MTLEGSINELRRLDGIIARTEEEIVQVKRKLSIALTNAVKASGQKEIDQKAIDALEKHYWTVVKKEGNEYVLVVPKAWDVNFGWRIFEDDAWRHFRVNHLTNWISDIPDFVKKELDFKEPFSVHLEGDYLVGKDIDEIAKKFPQFVRRYGDKLAIKSGSRFDLINALVREGTMPFTNDPIPKELLYKRPLKFELYPYQKKIIDDFLERSNLGVFIPTGGGKTYIGLAAMSMIKPPYLIVTNKTLVEQWMARIEGLTEIKKDEYDIMTWQGAVKNTKSKKYNLIIRDECHKYPADTYSQLMGVETATSLGLSASPFREDQREDLIVTMTGYPEKIPWVYLKDLGVIKMPECHVWIVKNQAEKFVILDKLMKKELKTFVYSDGLDLGEQIAKRYSIPFVHGQTGNRMDVINNNYKLVLSRVGDEGIDDPTIECVVEMDWHGSSKRQSIQRVGRLTHTKSEKEGEHHILMTVEEYVSDKRRFVPLIENGFNVSYHSEISDINEQIQKVEARVPKPRQINHKKESKTVEKQNEPLVDVTNYPLLKHKGVRKIYDSLGPGDKKILLFFIDPENADKGFTIKNIMMSLGYTMPTNAYRALKNLRAKKCIVKDGILFRQNFSSMIAS